MKNFGKLMLILLIVVALLASAMIYMLINSKPKDISFSDENLSQNEQIPTSNIDKKEAQSTRQKEEISPQSPIKETAQGTLRGEYTALLARAKKDTDLSRTRYTAYILDNKALSTKEKELIKDIINTLSRRGGYLNYALFVDRGNSNELKLYLFNENLLDNDKWQDLGLFLPHLWFKFNQSTMQSIKNSFHIKRLKKEILGYKVHSLMLKGHTDELGSSFYNSMLGLKRTAAVASEFLRITAKITMQSYGKNMPLSKGLKEKDRYKNRRVEASFD